MKISIVIPTLKENYPYLKMCVDSIKKYSHENHEIIVAVNNLKGEEIPDTIKQIEGIKLLAINEQGQGRATNLAVEQAINKYILVADDDTVFPPNWEELTEKAKEVEFLSGVFMENGKKGGIAPAFIQGDCGNTPEEFDWNKWKKESIERREEKMENGFGFPLVCKKELWQKVEGYDSDGYDPWGSNIESDLEYKIMLYGIMPKRWRGVITYHFAQISGTFTKPEAEPYLQKNRSYFERKWGIARAKALMIWYCEFGIPLDTLRYRPDWANFTENNKNIIPNDDFNKCIECSKCRFYYLDFRYDKCPRCGEIKHE